MIRNTFIFDKGTFLKKSTFIASAISLSLSLIWHNLNLTRKLNILKLISHKKKQSITLEQNIITLEQNITTLPRESYLRLR